MKILLKNVTVIQPQSKFHQQKVHLFIENGIIKKIDKKGDSKADKVIEIKDLHISEGWFDSSVSFGEPGYEDRETLENGLKTTAKSGFTQIALNPNTLPVSDTATALEFLQKNNAKSPVQVYPVGALTQQSKGEHLAELFDMQKVGAIVFGDYKRPVANANLLKIALQYAKPFGGIIQSFPLDQSIARTGYVNEGKESTILGLKGIPNIAEEMQIERDLTLLAYTEGKLHIPTISTKRSVELIKKAKKDGLDVSCSVSVHHLFYTDDKLESFNANYKVLPPLRTKEDNKALQKAVKDGTIDMITSDHQPIEIEGKKVEFENAAYGTIGLESAFGVCNKILGTEKTIEMFTQSKKRFGIENSIIKENEKANLTLFTTNETSTLSESNLYSTCKNAIFLGEKLQGKVVGVIANKKIILND
ncbi:dihydroorotase family protein [Mesonia sp. K7]|uniref:dihydroorotase n=1 Tax=Mesonia sp. K7 TaxID=2218606 RepID=UPI000DA81AC2|nr:dihydroorotase [Mesonia sp. K7]PZD78208.1 dihydroorotase [Mesonia sp. K7]